MKMPVLIWSDGSCNLAGKTYRTIPVLLDAERNVVICVTDWLRSLLKREIADSSVAQYAYTILNYWKYLCATKCAWDCVNESVLIRWRNEDSGVSREVKKKTINDKLSVVLRFYYWAQIQGYIAGVIGDPAQNSNETFSIKIHRVVNRSRVGMTSDIHFRRRGGNGIKAVPTSDEMDDAFVRLARGTNDRGVATRNALMLRWASEAGFRRSETLSLTISHLPSLTEAIKAGKRDEVCNITIIGKGAKTRTVPVDPELIVCTLDYIDGERREVLNSLRNPIRTDRIFISHTTGKPLSATYVSALLSAAFKGSEAHLTGHRARARYITRYFSEMLDQEVERHGNLYGISVETLLFRAAEILGHSDLNSLKYYLRLELKKRMQ